MTMLGMIFCATLFNVMYVIVLSRLWDIICGIVVCDYQCISVIICLRIFRTKISFVGFLMTE